MNKEQILTAIKTLAASQGFYGRLYEQLSAKTEQAERALDLMERQNFKDMVDMILWIEG